MGGGICFVFKKNITKVLYQFLNKNGIDKTLSMLQIKFLLILSNVTLNYFHFFTQGMKGLNLKTLNISTSIYSYPIFNKFTKHAMSSSFIDKGQMMHL